MGETSGALIAETPGATVEIGCPFCGSGVAAFAAAGNWTNAGTAYTELLYVHTGCPAADPQARSARPSLLTVTTRRRRWPFRRNP